MRDGAWCGDWHIPWGAFKLLWCWNARNPSPIEQLTAGSIGTFGSALFTLRWGVRQCDSATVIYGMSAKNYGELTIIQLCKILTHGQVNFVTVQIIPTTFKMAHFVNHVLIFLFLIRHYITTSSSPLSSSVTLSLFHPWFKTFLFAEIFAFIDHWHLPDWPFHNWTCVQFKK